MVPFRCSFCFKCLMDETKLFYNYIDYNYIDSGKHVNLETDKPDMYIIYSQTGYCHAKIAL